MIELGELMADPARFRGIGVIEFINHPNLIIISSIALLAPHGGMKPLHEGFHLSTSATTQCRLLRVLPAHHLFKLCARKRQEGIGVDAVTYRPDLFGIDTVAIDVPHDAFGHQC